MAEGVIVKTVIYTMVFDGSTTDLIQKAVRDAMIAFMAATAQGRCRPELPRQAGRLHQTWPSATLRYYEIASIGRIAAV
jgi:hypothetical protein